MKIKQLFEIAHNFMQHDRAKHVEIDHHSIKEKFVGKIIHVSFGKSEDQECYILTKVFLENIVSL